MYKKILKAYGVEIACGASAVLIAGGFFWAFAVLRAIKEPLIFHFTAFAITETGGMAILFGIAFIGLVAVGIDFILARELKIREPLLAQILAIGSLFFGILLFAGFRAIISVNLIQ